MGPEGRVARVTELIADSKESFEDAVITGFKRATKTLRGIGSPGERTICPRRERRYS